MASRGRDGPRRSCTDRPASGATASSRKMPAEVTASGMSFGAGLLSGSRSGCPATRWRHRRPAALPRPGGRPGDRAGTSRWRGPVRWRRLSRHTGLPDRWRRESPPRRGCGDPSSCHPIPRTRTAPIASVMLPGDCCWHRRSLCADVIERTSTTACCPRLARGARFFYDNPLSATVRPPPMPVTVNVGLVPVRLCPPT